MSFNVPWLGTMGSKAWHRTCLKSGSSPKQLKNNTNPKKDRQETMKLNAIKTGKNSKLGIAMTEYLIILGVVAVAAILVVGLFGKQVKSVFTRNNAALTGQTVSADTATVTTSQGATVQENMGSFDAQASKKGQ
jgi:Flp pilus assembly pilin Flp